LQTYLDGGRLGLGRGDVYYFALDRLEWEPLDKGYTDFLAWCFDGDLNLYYEGFRWSGWESDVMALGGDRAYSFYPPPFTKEFSESPRCGVTFPCSISIDSTWRRCPPSSPRNARITQRCKTSRRDERLISAFTGLHWY
jgi:hypothetical protein